MVFLEILGNENLPNINLATGSNLFKNKLTS